MLASVLRELILTNLGIIFIQVSVDPLHEIGRHKHGILPLLTL